MAAGQRDRPRRVGEQSAGEAAIRLGDGRRLRPADPALPGLPPLPAGEGLPRRHVLRPPPQHADRQEDTAEREEG